MRICIIALALLASTVAQAECPKTGEIFPLGCGVVPQSGWNPFGTVALSKEELAAQVAANRAYHAALRTSIVAAGGTNADVLPFWMAEGINATVFGGPQMGSQN